MSNNPYPPPGPIGSHQQFFGRRWETSLVRAYLVAYRWSVVFGRSGAGKSSLFRAGIASKLSEPEQRRHRVLVLTDWSDATPLWRRIAEGRNIEACTEADLIDKIWRDFRNSEGGRLFLILDQFERYLSRSAGPDQLLATIVAGRECPIHICAGIRQDELSALDRLRELGFNPFQNLFGLPDLDLAAAREVIMGPLEEPDRADVEPRIGAILEHLANANRESTTRSENSNSVWAAILGIVCYEGWEIYQKTGVLFADVRVANSAISNYVEKALKNICRNEPYGRVVVGILRCLLEKGVRNQIDEPKLNERLNTMNLDVGSVPDASRDLCDSWLVEHEGHRGYRVIHDLFVEPILGCIGVSEQQSQSLEAAGMDIRERKGFEDKLNFLEQRLTFSGLVLSLMQGGIAGEIAKDEITKIWQPNAAAMESGSAALKGAKYAGSTYGAVSFLDCLRSAR